MTWAEARSFCQTDAPGEGDLASIHDKATNDFLTTLTTEYSLIGGTDEGSEGVWRWSDGSSWDYENWHSGEPNNAGGGQQVALKVAQKYTDTGTWDDGYDYRNYPFICQSKTSVPTATTQTTTTISPTSTTATTTTTTSSTTTSGKELIRGKVCFPFF